MVYQSLEGYLSRNWRESGVQTFLKGICPKFVPASSDKYP